MTKQDLIKDINRRLDFTRIDAKRARKNYDRENEKYYQGKEQALLDVLSMVKELEVAK